MNDYVRGDEIEIKNYQLYNDIVHDFITNRMLQHKG